MKSILYHLRGIELFQREESQLEVKSGTHCPVVWTGLITRDCARPPFWDYTGLPPPPFQEHKIVHSLPFRTTEGVIATHTIHGLGQKIPHPGGFWSTSMSTCFVRDVVPGGTRGTQNRTGVSFNRGPELAILPRALGPRGGSGTWSDRQGAWAALPISLPLLCVWAKTGKEGRTFTAMGARARCE